MAIALTVPAETPLCSQSTGHSPLLTPHPLNRDSLLEMSPKNVVIHTSAQSTYKIPSLTSEAAKPRVISRLAAMNGR